MAFAVIVCYLRTVASRTSARLRGLGVEVPLSGFRQLDGVLTFVFFGHLEGCWIV